MAPGPDKYKWDGDSRDERDSDFVASTHGTPPSAGVAAVDRVARRAPRRRGFRLAALAGSVVIGASLSAMVLYGVLHHFRL